MKWRKLKMSDDSITVKFHDHSENQEGFAVVRKFQGRVSICLSLERNGDVEALVDNDVVQGLIDALQQAIEQQE